MGRFELDGKNRRYGKIYDFFSTPPKKCELDAGRIGSFVNNDRLVPDTLQF